MKRKTVLITAGLTLATALLLAWAFSPRPVGVETATAVSGAYEQSISEDGKTRLSERYVVSAPLTGRLARITLKEGARIEAGNVVATLSPVLSPMLDERASQELKARLAGAEAGMERSQARIERSKVALEQAGNTLRSSEQLAAKGFIAPTKLDTDRLLVSAARKEMDTALAEKHVASHELDQARAALSSLRQPATNTSRPAFELRSPIAGQVLRVLQASESSVSVGTPLMEIGDVSRLEIVTELLTTDALAARPGSRVVIDRWGGTGTLEGRVSLIEPAAFTKISALGVEEQRVRAVIELVSPPEQWRALGDGFRVGVRIVTLTQPQALQVPGSAVFPLPARTDGQPQSATAQPQGFAVFRAVEGRARLAPVELAGRNGHSAWIRSGLEAGQTVIVYPPANVSDGTRIAVRKP